MTKFRVGDIVRCISTSNLDGSEPELAQWLFDRKFIVLECPDTVEYVNEFYDVQLHEDSDDESDFAGYRFYLMKEEELELVFRKPPEFGVEEETQYQAIKYQPFNEIEITLDEEPF